MSTYSTNLAIELITTGTQAGVWGSTTNTNLGTLIEQAISGYTTQAVTGGTDTLAMTPGASATARNMYLELTGTGGGTLVVPSNKKLYFIYNNSSGSVTVKVSGQTGVPVPLGAKILLVCNGTDVVLATNYMISPTFTAPTMTTPVLGTPASGTMTNVTGLPLTTGVTGTLPATNGGTGQSSYAVGDIVYASTTTALSKLPDVATGNALISGGVGTAPSYGKIGLTTHISGTLAAANGGTGLTSPSTAGNVLTSDGSGWVSSTPTAATGGSGDAVFFLNSLVVAHDYTIPSDKNAGTFGPITVNDGVTVTVPDTSVWTVV